MYTIEFSSEARKCSIHLTCAHIGLDLTMNISNCRLMTDSMPVLSDVDPDSPAFFVLPLAYKVLWAATTKRQQDLINRTHPNRSRPDTPFEVSLSFRKTTGDTITCEASIKDEF